MSNNLFIIYRLDKKTDRDSIERAVHSLGNSTPIFSDAWYVNGIEDAEEAVKRISSWMTDKDHLLVIDSAKDVCLWFNLDEKVARRIQQNWRMDLSKTNQSPEPQEAKH